MGRPILYGTTDQFLQHFGLTTIDDLPEPEALHSLEQVPTQQQFDL
ncbi:MAG: SMC-Scp complex subunit ScpB [Clostridiales bacterium]|nr:SMC-Scp complex subunit ScpB [Clostridiales bacterium]